MFRIKIGLLVAVALLLGANSYSAGKSGCGANLKNQGSHKYEVMFDSAKSEFFENVDLDRVEVDLKSLAKGKFAVLTNSERVYLKTARKSGLVLRAAFRFFSENNEPPKRFGKFVRIFGELNDDIALMDAERAAAARLPDTASKLLEILAKPLKLEFVATTAAGHARQWEKKKAQVRTLLDQDILTVDQFHDLRKIIRDFRTYFELLGELAPSARIANASANLRSLSTDMGVIKDKLEQSQSTDPVQLSDKIRLRVEAMYEEI